MSSKTEFLMIGATGYIGGLVLERFVGHPDAASFHIVALVRSAEKAEKIKALFRGVDTVVGSMSDLALTERLASEADVVISMADCDDLPVAQATLKGLKKRYEATGKPPVFIHTGGTGVVATPAHGMFRETEVYDDMNPEQFEALAPTQHHRLVDIEIVNADKEGYVRTYIILPSSIYGISTGKLAQAGIANPHSIPIPLYIKMALFRGEGVLFGEGKNVWPDVEIHELADLYPILYNSIIRDPSTGHGREGFYFGCNGQYTGYQVSKAISQALLDLGIGKSGEPTHLTPEEVERYASIMPYMGTNCRCVANRSYSIGWAPKKTTDDMIASIKPEVEAFIAKGYGLGLSPA